MRGFHSLFGKVIAIAKHLPMPFTVAALAWLIANSQVWRTSSPSAGPATVAVKQSFAYVPIEELKVGNRVLSSVDQAELDYSFDEVIKPHAWRRIILRAPKRDGGWAHVELLRPLTWLQDNKVHERNSAFISVPECGINSQAEVLSILPCPEISPGHGYVVTGFYRHSATHIFDVHVSTSAEPIRTTRNHPFWSEDRQAFVAAADLNSGERLRALTGDVFVDRVVATGRAEEVFNLEVHLCHLYFVGRDGILVHNSGLTVLNPCIRPILRHGDSVGEARRLNNAGHGIQFHHLNQDAAYGSRIPHRDGLSIPLRGRAATRGSEHNLVHTALEDFWEKYRKSGKSPTNAEYDTALRSALKKAGLDDSAVREAADAARQQRLDRGLTDDDFVPRIPGRPDWYQP
jgi:hypothetical protein